MYMNMNMNMKMRSSLSSFGRTILSSSSHQQQHRSSSSSILSTASRLIRPTGTSTSTQLLCSNSNTNTNMNASSSKTNEYLVQARIQAQKEKLQTRQKSLDEDRERNLRIKRLIHTEAGTGTCNDNDNDNNNEIISDSGFQIPKLYALRISVDAQLRSELKLNGREKRGRVFIEMDSVGSTTLKGLKMELHSFFRCLKRSTYILSACPVPKILEDGSIDSPSLEDEGENNDDTNDNDNDNDADPFCDFVPIENDEDVVTVFEKSVQYYNDHNTALSENALNKLKRPSVLVHVRKDPNAPKPPPPPSYLEHMADPNESETMTMLSFYSFPEGDGEGEGGNGIKDPEEFGLFLRKVWKPFGALGRVYVAKEGVNAQMSIPTNVLDNFRQCCMQIPELGKYMENGINIDPVPLTMEQFAVAGDMDGRPVPPFRNLHIRVRQQIVADGLDKSLDWENAGYDMPPLEWHQKLKEARDAKNMGESNQNADKNDESNTTNDAPIIFDCRNDYETAVGKFEGAIPLNTTNFRDSWEVLEEQLKDAPKDAPIMTYCTGGIRCVKVGAYLTQELGFTNVSRLAGGIIAYDRTLNNEMPDAEPMFKGTNYVFDGRQGRQITDDALGECITCGAKTNLVANCRNEKCHKRMVQCSKCRGDFLGTCSDACKNRVMNDMNSPQTEEGILVNEVQYTNVNDYSLGYSTPVPNFYEEIKQNTAIHLGSGIHMISDSAQGMLLKNLASMSREGRVLEIGSFTGYATSRFLEGAADAGEIICNGEGTGSRESGPFVMSLERDQRAIDLTAFHIRTMSKYGVGKEAAEAASKIREDGAIPPLIEEDSIYFTYKNAGCEIIRVSDALAFVEAISSGIEKSSISPFDIVFIDADKTRFLQYVEACLSNDKVLKKGGMMIVDNVLWKGLVLDLNGGSNDAVTDDEDKMKREELKKSRRARKLANIVHKFNDAIVKDERVEVLMLPIRDGLSLIRKK